MDRRGFLQIFGAGIARAVVGAELDLERMLWVPKPMVTVPALPAGNQFVTPDWMVKEYLKVLKREKAFVASRMYDPGFYVGRTVTVRLPVRYEGPIIGHAKVETVEATKDSGLGIAIRFIKEFDIVAFDIVADVTPALGVRRG